MDLLIGNGYEQKLKTTIYGIYKVLELQEKFGLDVIASCRSLNSRI